MKIVHIIRQINRGGASFGLFNQCRNGPSGFCHEIVSLLPSHNDAAAKFENSGIRIHGQSATQSILREADLIQIEWWNNPEVVQFILDELPPCRIQLHSRGHFDAPYMCPSATLLNRVDLVTVTTPSAAQNPAFKALEQACGLPNTDCVYSTTAGEPRPLSEPRSTGVLGYLGTIETIKMHPRAMDMIAKILKAVPGTEFHFAGEGSLSDFRLQAENLGIADRVKFLGFIKDVPKFLSSIDMLFYPLNPFTYATSEKVVQEAMLSGAVVAALPYGGLRDLLEPGCALLSKDESSLVEQSIQLLQSPTQRLALAQKAQLRLDDWSVARNWRRRAAAAWKYVSQQPKRARTSVLPSTTKSLLEASFEPSACVAASPDAVTDCAAVAEFVLESYVDFTIENLAESRA